MIGAKGRKPVAASPMLEAPKLSGVGAVRSVPSDATTLGWPTLSYAGALWILTLLGFFGGFFIVPIAAIMQYRPERGQKGAVLATGNLLSFVGIALASGVFSLTTTSSVLFQTQPS